MSQLRLVQPQGEPERVTVDELLALLTPDHFDAIEEKAKVMRESYHCPFMVRDYEEFKDTLYDFYAHYQKAFFNADLKHAASTVEGSAQVWKAQAYDFLQKHLGGYDAILAAERNAIMGREGGMISIIDNFTDAIIKLHTQTYIESVFFERIAPSDFDTRMRLAAELLRQYGPYLFPGEELLPHYVVGMNVQEFIRDFALHLYPIRKRWRY